MELLSVAGGDLEYETAGAGEPVVLIHGVLMGDALVPLLTEPALTSRYQLVHYHRRGFMGSSAAPHGPFSIAQQAADALGVIQHVAGGRAHIVGHSFGGNIALQLAIDAPDAVQSLGLLEGGLPGAVAAADPEALVPIRAAYASGDRAGTVDQFLTLAIGPGYRASVDETLPAGWFEQTVADLDILFNVDGPAFNEWEFTEASAGRVRQPALVVVGAESPPSRSEDYALLQRWFPEADSFVLPGASHALQMQNPRGMAEALAAFLARHPMPAVAPV